MASEKNVYLCPGTAESTASAVGLTTVARAGPTSGIRLNKCRNPLKVGLKFYFYIFYKLDEQFNQIIKSLSGKCTSYFLLTSPKVRKVLISAFKLSELLQNFALNVLLTFCSLAFTSETI